MKQNKNNIIIIVFLLIINFAYSCNTFAAGVKPLVVDIDAKPGDTKEFKLNLTPGGVEEKVKFSVYQPVQLTNGSLTYQEAKKESFPAANWIKLDKKEVMVYPGQKTTVSGTVKVPFDAAGSNTVIIMVEPQKPSQKKSGVRFMVRYAVRVNIRVDRPGIRPEAELTKFGLVPDEEKKPQIKARISNPSKMDYLVSGEAILRDSKRRLIERITLKSPQGVKSNSNKTRMYPGSEVKYLGEITKRLSPGEYNLRVFFRYAEHGQIIKNKKITVKEGDFKLPSVEEIGSFSVEPKKIDLKLKPGQRKSKVIRLNSEISKDSQIKVGTKEIKKKYKYSMLNWLQIRGRKQFKLMARRNGRAILTVAVPKDTKKGSYHGNLVLGAFNSKTKKLLSKKEVPISVVVGQEHNYQVKVRSLFAKNTKQGYLLSLDLFNSGTIFIKPYAEMVIKDKENKFIERVQLNLAQRDNKLLPSMNGRLSGIAKELKPGQYTAEITIENQGEKIKTVQKKFEVK